MNLKNGKAKSLAHIKKGGLFVLKQPGLLLMLCLYQLCWGLLGYRWLNAINESMLLRYPGTDVSTMSTQVYWAEAQFRILKTNVLEPWLWVLAGCLLLRMLLHPLLQASVFYSIHASDDTRDQGEASTLWHRLKSGMRALGPAFFGLYLLQSAMALGPLFLLIPKFIQMWQAALSLRDFLVPSFVWGAAYVTYLFLLRGIFLTLMLRKTKQTNLAQDERNRIRQAASTPLTGFPSHLVRVLILSGAFIAMTLFSSIGIGALGILWSGFAAIVLQQLYFVLRSGLLLWEAAACYSGYN